MNFRSFLNSTGSQNTVGTHNDAATATFLPSAFTGSQDLGILSKGMPGTDLELPTVTRESEILEILNAPATTSPRRTNDKSQKDMIKIIMKDGTTLHLTLPQYGRINARKRLERGQKLKVTFRRLPSDAGPEPSNIINVE